MTTNNPAVAELVEAHNQYASGLMTFSEFMVAALYHAQKPGVTDDLIKVNRMEYKEMVAWEKEVGLKPICEATVVPKK